MSNLSKAVEDLAGLGTHAGRRKYRELYGKEVAARIDEQSKRFDALESTVKTMNGMAQLALQQMTVLSKQLAEMKALPAPDENGENSDETEVKGE